MPEGRYVCKLGPELIKKATEELNEPTTDEERHAAIDQLKYGYSEEKFGKLVRDDDYFLIRFLRAKKFKQEKALKCLENYHKVRKEMPEVFEKVQSPILLKNIFDKLILYMLPGKAADGASIMMYRPGLLDKDVNMYDVMAYSVLSMEKVLEDESAQICGLRSLEDLDNFNLSLMLQISISDLAKMNKIWLEAMPMRFKAAHLINEGKVYDAIMTMFKPFMKKKILDRVRIHGSDYQSIHEFVDPKILPPYLGGSGLDPEKGGKEWNEVLSENWAHDTAL